MRGAPNQKYEDWIGSDSWKGGQESEDLFGALLLEKYPEARRATLEEQYKGMDWICSKGSIDVKTMKSLQRGSAKQQDFIWIEFKNNAGEQGWIHGEMDWIAFEKEDRYVLCKRWDLCYIAERLCDLTSMVQNSQDALYKGYSRKNRKDLLSMIRASDLDRIPTQALKKWRTSTSTMQATQSS